MPTTKQHAPAKAAAMIAVAGLVAMMGAMATRARAATVTPLRCRQLALSPNFVRDHVAFCAGFRRQKPSGPAEGVEVYGTVDSGSTWTSAQALGLPVPQTSDTLRDLMVSPHYATDHTILLRLSRSGLFRSTDRGATFQLVDPFGGFGRAASVVAPLRVGSAELSARPMLAVADPGTAEGANESKLIDAATGLAMPVKGSAGLDKQFIVSPNYEHDEIAFAVANRGIGLTAHVDLFRCGAAFECSTRITSLPNRMTFDRAWFVPVPHAAPMLILSMRSLNGAIVLYRSTDGGRTLARWANAERPFAERQRTVTPEIGFAWLADGRTMFLRISGVDGTPDGPPAEVMFRSRDRGNTWTQIAFGRNVGQRGSRGTVPFNGTDGSTTGYGETPTGFIQAAGDRLFSVGAVGIFCSVDGGVHWAHACAR